MYHQFAFHAVPEEHPDQAPVPHDGQAEDHVVQNEDVGLFGEEGHDALEVVFGVAQLFPEGAGEDH